MSEVRPMRGLAAAALRASPRLGPAAKELLWRTVYELISARRGDPAVSMLNYGYAAPNSRFEATVECSPDDRYGLALYHEVAGAGDLTDRDVLEVGCGRGGGAAFVFERFAPRSMTGLDLARRAIERCRERYPMRGVEFVAGNAERLPFPDASFDVVLSVESTHCYGDVSRFFAEAHRVLRPGGQLLLADLRATELDAAARDGVFAREDVACLRTQLADAGFRTIEDEDITANVVRALELDTPIRRARIERRVPRRLRKQALTFAAVEGSPVYRAFAAHELTYLRFVLEKPASAGARHLSAVPR
jgi:SAM-dependent methyltransferase